MRIVFTILLIYHVMSCSQTVESPADSRSVDRASLDQSTQDSIYFMDCNVLSCKGDYAIVGVTSKVCSSFGQGWQHDAMSKQCLYRNPTSSPAIVLRLPFDLDTCLKLGPQWFFDKNICSYTKLNQKISDQSYQDVRSIDLSQNYQSPNAQQQQTQDSSDDYTNSNSDEPSYLDDQDIEDDQRDLDNEDNQDSAYIESSDEEESLGDASDTHSGETDHQDSDTENHQDSSGGQKSNEPKKLIAQFDPEMFPVCSGYWNKKTAFMLSQTTSQSMQQAQNLITKQLPNYIHIKQSPGTHHKKKNGDEQAMYDLYYKDKRVCYYQLKALSVKGNLTIIGRVPKFPSEMMLSKLRWSKGDVKVSKILEKLDKKGGLDKLRFSECVALQMNEPIAAWDVSIDINDYPYRGVVKGDQIFEAHADFFSLQSGMASYYKKDRKNIETPVLEQEPVVKLSGEGILCNPRFVITPEPIHDKIKLAAAHSDLTATDIQEKLNLTGGFNLTFLEDLFPVESGLDLASMRDTRLAYEPSLNFIYSEKDIEFEQTSLFINAEKHVQYMRALADDDSWQTEQINIVLEDDKLGATYFMSKYDEDGKQLKGPRIHVGIGDGVHLRKLRLDGDVISHELSHHYIYRSITNTNKKSEAVLLHEGIADYFVFARTKDSCLGEWICPTSSKVCSTKSCLRTAEEQVHPDDFKEVHKKSQAVSSMLWHMAMDLGIGQIGLNAVARVTNYALDYLTKDPSLVEFVWALNKAREDHKFAFSSCIIKERAEASGLLDKLDEKIKEEAGAPGQATSLKEAFKECKA